MNQTRVKPSQSWTLYTLPYLPSKGAHPQQQLRPRLMLKAEGESERSRWFMMAFHKSLCNQNLQFSAWQEIKKSSPLNANKTGCRSVRAASPPQAKKQQKSIRKFRKKKKTTQLEMSLNLAENCLKWESKHFICSNLLIYFISVCVHIVNSVCAPTNVGKS